MKYICTEQLDGTEEIFVFPKSIDHDAMYEALARIKSSTRGNWERVSRAPISAGFVDSEGNCYGESITLRVASRKEDTGILFNLLNAGRY